MSTTAWGNEMAEAAPAAMTTEGKREKRTIPEIRESKEAGEKMVYMSVPDYTSAQWAERAGVDVAVLGACLAMLHGHRSTIPATIDAEHEKLATMVAKRRQI